ncbi:MAG: hypothetical protein WAL95_11010 [Candidatus Acidiferrales bacterium]
MAKISTPFVATSAAADAIGVALMIDRGPKPAATNSPITRSSIATDFSASQRGSINVECGGVPPLS